MLKTYIALHPKHHQAQTLFINVANQVQQQISFKAVDITYDDRLRYSDAKKRVDATTLLEIAYELKRKYKIKRDDLFVLFYDVLAYDEEDDDLYFITVGNESFAETPGVAIISARANTLLLQKKLKPQEFVANIVLLNLLGVIACYFTTADLHSETNGCVLDYCDTMDDIKYALANGFNFCEKNKCYQKLHRNTLGRSILRIAASLSENRIRTIQDLDNLIQIERSNMTLIAKPTWGFHDITTDSKSCFILMPFKMEWSDRIWKRYLIPTIKKCGLTPTRADELAGRKIMEDIWICICSSRLVVADMTGKNPNVFYELGMAHAIGKPCILLAQTEEDVPFDLRTFRIIFYKDNADGYDRIEKELPKHIKAILDDEEGRTSANNKK